jgi:O-antigen/teichoic acid export membrane protein
VLANVVNLLLIPLYSSVLTVQDYGYLALLLLFSTVAKVVFRLGLDAGFFRVHYLLDDDGERRKLAGTVALFSALFASLLFAAVVLLRGPLTSVLLGADAPSRSWVVLAAADIFLGTFAFVPLNLLRIQDRPGHFSAFSLGRHAVNTVLKVVFVLQGHGVTGILWSDLLATALFSLALLPTLRRGARLALSREHLRDVLAFGLPKVPHGILVQALNLADRKILDLFVTLAEVGMYQMAYTVGGGVKFALSAFEPAWAPFVYAQVKKDDAPRTLARVVTYAFAGFTATGLAVAVLGRELLIVLTPRNPAFWPAAPVIPWVALAYVLPAGHRRLGGG